MKSLKAKLILGISLFIIVLLTVAAFIQVQEKEKELIDDIFIRARSFAELTADKLIEDYKLYLVPNSFVYFNREVQDIFAKNEDIEWIQLVNFNGDILYDSTQDTEQKFTGEGREITDPSLLSQIKSKKLSVKSLSEDKFIYYQKEESGEGQIMYMPVDKEDFPVDGLSVSEKISYLVQPVDEEYSAIFGVTYDALSARIRSTQIRILILAIFGVALGILLAIIFGSTITKPLAVLKQGAEILATGDLTHRVQVKTKDEIYQLAQTFNKMAADLQESTKALIYKERVGKELELAQEIQKSIIPIKIPQVKGIQIAAGIIPAEEIGGDCYDFMITGEDEILFYLGDVTGHGVPSGIVVSIANALFYSYARAGEMGRIMSHVNTVLKVKTMPNMFITLVLMKWVSLKGKFTYVSAGHEQILHYRAKDKSVVLLPSGGLALGMVPDISRLVKEQDVDLQSGDALFIYSDGIPEAWRNDNEMYGTERLKAVFGQYASLPSALSIKNAMMTDVYLYRQGYKQMDDITCIVVRKD